MSANRLSIPPRRDLQAPALAAEPALPFDRWLQGFSAVFKASRVPSSVQDVKDLLEEIAQNALEVSGADFVVLYEYFEEKNDVRLPPTFRGPVRDVRVLIGRGEEIAHKRSAVFHALQRGKPFYAEQAAKDWRQAELIDTGPAEERSFFAREGVASSAAIPLKIDEERVGILFVNYRTATRFDPRFCRYLELFANHAALAIGNVRFLLRSERYAKNLEVLNDIGRLLSSAVTLSVQEIGKLIDRQTRRVIPASNFFICLYDQVREQFFLPHHRDERDRPEIVSPQLGEGLAAYVYRTGKPLLANREAQDRLFASGEAKLVGEQSAIWLGAPMIVRQKVLGVIVVQDYEDETAFTGEHLHLLSAVASQAAIAIDNYRLLSEARGRLDELSALLELSQAFGAKELNLRSLLSSVLDQLCTLASGDGSLLFLSDLGKVGQLKVFAASSSLQEFRGEPLPLGEGVAGRVALTQSHLVINDYDQWPGRSPLFDKAQTGPPKRVCGVPLVWRDLCIGVITLSSSNDKKSFSQHEIEILQRFAGPAAIAIRNVRDSSFRRALIDGGPHAIVASNTRGRVIEFNEAAASLFGYRPEDLLGEKAESLYWGGHDEAKRIETLLVEQGTTNEETFGRTKQGGKIPLWIAAASLKDEEGETLGSVGVLEDLRLTALRGRNRQLVDAIGEINKAEDLEEIFELVVFHAVTLLYADAGCLFLKEGESLIVQASNGYSEEELKRVRADATKARIAEIVACGEPLILSLDDSGVMGLDLLRQASSVAVAPIRVENRSLAALLVESQEPHHFKADRALLEVLTSQAAVSINRIQLLKESEKTQQGLLMSANAIAVGQIATSFIHETKNALNGMSLTVLNLREDVESEPALKDKRDYVLRLSNIQAEFLRIDNLARRLQRFTQQGLQPQKEDVYFNELVGRTLQLLGSALRSKALKLEKKLDSSLDPPSTGTGNPIRLDDSQIQQVLMNLILNAIAASPQRGRLLIETKNHAHQVEFRLTDYGRGISEDDRRKLFQPFFTTKEEGTGLGLFISRVLVEKNHGGTIQVSGSPGKGATFSVMLPRHLD